MSMDPDIHATVTRELIARHGLRRQGGWLRRGKCPSRGKRELWTSAKAPWTPRCSRLNKCGWEAPTRELFPEAFARLNERFAPTPAHPTATADAYMAFPRGLDVAFPRGPGGAGTIGAPSPTRAATGARRRWPSTSTRRAASPWNG